MSDSCGRDLWPLCLNMQSFLAPDGTWCSRRSSIYTRCGGGGGGVSEGLGGHAAWGGLIMWGDGLRGALCVGCLAAMWMLP